MGFERSCNWLRNLLLRLNQSQLKPKPTAVTGNLLALISSNVHVLATSFPGFSPTHPHSLRRVGRREQWERGCCPGFKKGVLQRCTPIRSVVSSLFFNLLDCRLSIIVGFHMTSIKFKLKNCQSYRDFTFTMH